MQGLTEVEVLTMADIEEVIATGDKHRSVANTVMNTNRYMISASSCFVLLAQQCITRINFHTSCCIALSLNEL